MADDVVVLGVIELVLLLTVVFAVALIFIVKLAGRLKQEQSDKRDMAANLAKAEQRREEIKGSLASVAQSVAQGLGGPAFILRKNVTVFQNRTAENSGFLKEYEQQAHDSARNAQGGKDNLFSPNVLIGNRKFDVRLISIPRVGSLVYFEEIDPFRTVFSESLTRLMHKFTNPLSNIIWASEHLREEFDARRTELAEYNAWAATAQAITGRGRELDAFAKAVSGLADLRDTELQQVRRRDYTHINLKKLVEGCSTYLREQAENEASINIMSPPSLPLVEGHEAYLRQAVENLLENAIKYSAQAAHITVRLTHIEAQGDIRCEVIDKGQGIPEEDLEKIFLDGFRSRENRQVKGFGFGLAYTKAIIEDLHGGKIKVESTEGQGSTFTFQLPCAKTP